MFYILAIRRDEVTPRVMGDDGKLYEHRAANHIKFYRSKYHAVCRCERFSDQWETFIVPVPENAMVDASGALRLDSGETIQASALTIRARGRHCAALRRKEAEMKKNL